MKIIYRGKTKKGREIIVRFPVEKDTKSLLEYINTLSKEQTHIRFQGEQMSFDEEKKYMDDYFKKFKKGEAIKLLAFHNDKLIGLGDITMKDKIEKHVGLFGLTVTKEYRGEGIGKLLLNLIIENAKKYLPEIKIIQLGVFANNCPAKNLYKKFGFKEFGKLPKGIIHKEKFVDHVYMHREL